MEPQTASGAGDPELANSFGFLRFCLVAASVIVALLLGWNGIHRQQRDAFLRNQQTISKKAEFRRFGAILRCVPGGSMFSDTEPDMTTTIVPPPEQRAAGFDLARVDRIVETQACKLDTSPQDVWAATHPEISPSGRTR